MLKTLGAQVKEFKKDSFLTPVFMILEVLMETIIPLMMASIIDDGVEKSDMKATWLLNILRKINYQPKDVVDISLNPEVKLSKKYGKKFNYIRQY